MLNRQKCLLYLIDQAQRPVTHLELTKWAFLLAHETPSGGGSSFYDFLPYLYGPFSFALFREADKLVRSGYLLDTVIKRKEGWKLAPDPPVGKTALPSGVRSDATGLVRRFADKAPDELINYVYERFPWYTANSQIRQLEKRRVAPPAIYTIGYEGCSIDRLLNSLMRKGIQRIIDVRRNPVARRYGFHKSTLTRLCGRFDINYVHMPEVGIPSELRRNLDGPDDYAALFDKYERELLPRQSDALANISKLMSDKPTALMCMEADPAMCHRSRVAKTVSSITHLSIHHIRGKKCDLALS